MATKLEIINYALSYLGNPPVNTLDLSNTVVQAMSSIYDQQLPDVLASHPWRFALKWAELIQDTSTPEDPRWNYAYQLPGDYIQAYQSYPWANYTIVTDRIIWTNINPPFKWGYIAKVSEGLFPPYFSKLLSYVLAAESAMLVTENVEIAQYWEQKAMAQMFSAQNRDSTAQPIEPIKDQRLWSSHFV